MRIRTIILLLLVSANQIWALEFQFISDSLRGSLGDIIRFSWVINHAPDVTLSLGEIDMEGSGIEILDQEQIPADVGTDLLFETAVYDSVGFYHFPAFVVYTEGSQGVDSLVLQGPELQIYSILTASDTTFRDIKGLHKIRVPFKLIILLWVLAFGVLVYLGYFLIKRFKTKNNQRLPERIIVPPEQAHEIALRELERLKRSKYLHLEQFKAYHSSLTHILKQYYENRYLIDALELTTSELIEKMETMGECDTQLVSETRAILETADLIKFAKGSSNEIESGAALIRTVEIVNQTKIDNEQGVTT
ncbi:MAG: hypothetical protein L3J79_06640 [Candidatus Marinimicrobia bacterium]|nr:hypothetical protein [Candidatus Neomarinimicrobiota bacterium]